MNLPAYVRARTEGQSLAQRGLQNVGSGAGPYLSIEGNRFALVDAAGNHQPIQTLYVDVCILDINDHMSKMYYDSDWEPNNTVPPACFSDNGVAPSSQARQPQSVTCETCPHNVWGSKVSKMGSEVKACRDEQKTAFMVPGMPNNLFRLTVPPNSLKNWRAYLAKFQNVQFDISDVLTRVEFEQGVNGTLTFNPAPNPWLDNTTVTARDKAVTSKASDIIVGRLDRPRQAALPSPLPASTAAPLAAIPSVAPQGQPLAPPIPPATPTAFAPTPASIASPSEPQKRRRRTNAEIAADNAAKATPQATPAMAPFRPEAQPSNGSGAPFGIQADAPPPNQEIADAIKNIFG